MAKVKDIRLDLDNEYLDPDQEEYNKALAKLPDAKLEEIAKKLMRARDNEKDNDTQE